MNLKKEIRPVTYLKTKASDLLYQVNETRRAVVITQNGEPMAVLQDAESYQNMKNAIGLLKLISVAEDDIREGNLHTHKNVMAGMKKKIKAQ